jgi:hypothetical protein
MVVRDRFWFLFARQRKKNPFPSKMEGSGEVEYLKPISEKKPQSNVEFEAKTTRAKEGDFKSSFCAGAQKGTKHGGAHVQHLSVAPEKLEHPNTLIVILSGTK